MLLLLILIVSGVSSMAQDKMHCIPLAESRRLHEDAMKRYFYQALADSTQSKVIVLEKEKIQTHTDFNKRLAIADQKYNLAVTQKKDQAELGKVFEEERDHYKKKSRKLTMQRNGLGLLTIAAIILLL